MRTRILVALLVAYAAATAIHIGFVMLHEPFVFDAWNVAVDTRGEPFSVGRWFDYWGFEYTHSNPRIGQGLAYLAYKLEYFAVIATPVAYLGISLAVTVLGIGRWPRGRDWALWAIAIGFGWFVFPELGRNMFDRAYGANYVYGAAIQLWFLVPLRLAARYEVPWGKVAIYGLFGVIAGACNEHTGPALLGLLAIAGWKLRERRPRLLFAGAVGFAIGFAAIFFAPGQGERYGGLVTKTSLPMRLVQRGVIGAIDIVADYIQYAAPLLVVIVIALVLARRQRDAGRSEDHRPVRFVMLSLGLGLALAVTLFVSPKLGGRFYLMSMALLLAATIGLCDAVMSARHLGALVAIGLFASGFAAVRTMPLYARVHAQSDARLAGLEATPVGDIFVADAFDQSDESWWFIGDDFDDPQKRERVASYLGLSRVTFRGFDIKSPLGTAGVRLTLRYRSGGQELEDPDLQPDLDGKGLDVAGIDGVARHELDLLRTRTTVDDYELAVELLGKQPPLPRPKLVILRSTPTGLEHHVGAIVRPGASLAREVKLEQPADGLELYIWQVGGEYRKLDDSLRFAPWRTGIYWALACGSDACFVIAAARAHAS